MYFCLFVLYRLNCSVLKSAYDVKLDVDENEIATYVLRFTVPFLALAAILYVIDTVIRKLKWADIKSFFKIRRKESKK